jgi:hypothetical protein
MMADRRDTGLDGGLNPQANASDVVSSYGGNIVSGRWALANRGMLDHQRTKTSKQSTPTNPGSEPRDGGSSFDL